MNVEHLFAYADEINFRQVAIILLVPAIGGCVEIRRYTTIFESGFITYLDPNKMR